MLMDFDLNKSKIFNIELNKEETSKFFWALGDDISLEAQVGKYELKKNFILDCYFVSNTEPIRVIINPEDLTIPNK